ncbi:MAG: SDR family NAD(P)-dependent oxidoreductase [Epsilonproteobacteria bacterium]|nr:SDR family NAD(P)-dependent oxidoreductase [Campylobacterota bacterium]
MSKNILITGVSSGLGYALCHEYLNNGYTVYGLGRDRPQDISDSKFYFHSCDLCDLETIAESISSFLQQAETFEIVILNAGMLGEIKALHDTSVTELKATLDLNLWANKVLIDLFIDLKLPIRQIIGMSSGAAVNASKGWGGYTLSKSGLNMLLKLYAHEMSTTHLMALAPGVIDTPMVRHIVDVVDDERFPSAKRLKEGYIQTPQEAAGRLFETFPKLRSYESGSFVDIREI